MGILHVYILGLVCQVEVGWPTRQGTLLLQAYQEEYHNNVMYVEEYRPSDLFVADSGMLAIRC